MQVEDHSRTASIAIMSITSSTRVGLMIDIDCFNIPQAHGRINTCKDVMVSFLFKLSMITKVVI